MVTIGVWLKPPPLFVTSFCTFNVLGCVEQKGVTTLYPITEVGGPCGPIDICFLRGQLGQALRTQGPSYFKSLQNLKPIKTK